MNSHCELYISAGKSILKMNEHIPQHFNLLFSSSFIFYVSVWRKESLQAPSTSVRRQPVDVYWQARGQRAGECESVQRVIEIQGANK